MSLTHSTLGTSTIIIIMMTVAYPPETRRTEVLLTQVFFHFTQSETDYRVPAGQKKKSLNDKKMNPINIYDGF